MLLAARCQQQQQACAWLGASVAAQYGSRSGKVRSRRSGSVGGVRTRAAREARTTQQQQQQQQQAADAGAEPDADAAAPSTPPAPAPSASASASAPASASRRAYSPLHRDIEEFCRRVVPTHEEHAAKQRVIETVAAATRRGLDGVELPQGARVRVQPFGSFVSGLSTWDSDVDVVIAGIATPSRLTGGFATADKRFVARVLDRVARELRKARRLDLRSLVVIRTARIPIVKLQAGPAAGSVVADVSLGDDSGPAAARYVSRQIAAYPPLAPLCLVLKVYLRRCGLNEVVSGGLSSYALTLMVLAHLQEEVRAGSDIFDLGEALYGFLLRYGEEFDYGLGALFI